MATKTLSESLRILINPYADVFHARGILELLDVYARDPMGGGKPLSFQTKRDLIPELRRRPWIVTFLALIKTEPAGLLIAMEGFSTFTARPLLNIHDISVKPEFRGQGIGTALFKEAESIARKRGCCKMTLEVLDKNEVAKDLYLRWGFNPYVLDPEAGVAQFWEKVIHD